MSRPQIFWILAELGGYPSPRSFFISFHIALMFLTWYPYESLVAGLGGPFYLVGLKDCLEKTYERNENPIRS